MAFIKVASLAALPPGTVTEVGIKDDAYVLCNLSGEVHALWGICPHAGGPIGQGTLDGTYVICPWHDWEFDCRTGETDMAPEVKLPMFPVRIEGDDILIDPEAGS